MIDIVTWLPAKKKLSPSGWYSFNAVCCHHRGEKQDKRSRGGLKVATDGSFSYHCFNCNYKASFTLGKSLSFKARKFLEWLGVDTQTIEHLNLESLKQKSIFGLIQETPKPKLQEISFKTKELSDDLELLDINDSSHSIYIEYLKSRCVDITSYPFMISPRATSRNSKRIVIPFTYNNEIVGHSSRFIDNRIPKYIHDIPHGYAFGLDLQDDYWQKVIVVEGVFDALVINAVATLHSTINDEQAALINKLQREVIVVPDQDVAGMQLAERAMKLHWAVSIPKWGDDVKDVADAVKKYGKLGTLLTIMEATERNPLKIKLRMKAIHK